MVLAELSSATTPPPPLPRTAQVVHVLVGELGWKRVKRPPCDALFVKRWKVPWPMLDGGAGTGCAVGAVNHIRGTAEITVKARMCRSLRGWRAERGAPCPEAGPDPPTALLIPGAVGGDGTGATVASSSWAPRDERDRLAGWERDVIRAGGVPPIWIVKPTAGAHGAGIAIVASAAAACAHVDSLSLAPAAPATRVAAVSASTSGSSFPPSATSKTTERPWRVARAGAAKPSPAWVAQRLVARPLLTPDQRKFDVRAVCCLTHDGRRLWWPQYVLRVASKPHPDLLAGAAASTLSDRAALITNHCVQRAEGGDGYGAQEEGNELFRPALLSWVGATRLALIERGMRDCARAALGACHDVCRPPEGWGRGGGPPDGSDSTGGGPGGTEGRGGVGRSGRCRGWQVLGLDLIVDSCDRVWLLECNGSAAIADRLAPALARALAADVVGPAALGRTAAAARARWRWGDDWRGCGGDEDEGGARWVDLGVPEQHRAG